MKSTGEKRPWRQSDPRDIGPRDVTCPSCGRKHSILYGNKVVCSCGHTFSIGEGGDQGAETPPPPIYGHSVPQDIAEALYHLRRAFARHYIPVPDVLEYSQVSQAYDAMRKLRHCIGPAHWVMEQSAKSYGEVSIAGFTLRFEARKIERPGTGTELDDGITGRIFEENLWKGPRDA